MYLNHNAVNPINKLTFIRQLSELVRSFRRRSTRAHRSAAKRELNIRSSTFCERLKLSVAFHHCCIFLNFEPLKNFCLCQSFNTNLFWQAKGIFVRYNKIIPCIYTGCVLYKYMYRHVFPYCVNRASISFISSSFVLCVLFYKYRGVL